MFGICYVCMAYIIIAWLYINESFMISDETMGFKLGRIHWLLLNQMYLFGQSIAWEKVAMWL